jgi:hypothetical protein
MRFLITGDSWSQGEWDGYPTFYRITHSGVHQYLLDDGHEVYNVGQGGYNNLESLAAARNFSDQFDHLIFFYTDPLRQASESEIKTLLPFEIIKTHTIALLNELIELKQKQNCQITVIGGCAKFTLASPKIDYIVSSINEVIVPTFSDSEFMTSREWELHFHKYEKKFSRDQKEQWLKILSKAEDKYKLWNQKKEYFWPDGLHANRHGTKILYNKLKELWLMNS